MGLLFHSVIDRKLLLSENTVGLDPFHCGPIINCAVKVILDTSKESTCHSAVILCFV